MGNRNAESDWSRLVLGDWVHRLEKMALKRFGSQTLADEAVNHVLDKLSADNWSVLSGYKEKARPTTYLNVVASHILEEFSRKKFGRPRPPLWLQRNGHLWVSLWRQLCLERRAVEEVFLSWINPERSREYIASIVQTIKARMPWCGVKEEEIPASYLESDSGQAYSLEEAVPVEHAEGEADLEELLLIIWMFVSGKSPSTTLTPQQLESAQRVVDSLKETLDFSAEEMLALKLVYIDRVKQLRVAELLGVKPYKLNKQLKALVARLRAALEELGFEKPFQL